MKRPLRVALLQTPAFDLADHEQAWLDLLARIDAAGADGPDLIVTPEASYPAYFLHSREAYDAADVYDDESVEAALRERAGALGCHIVAGLVQRHPGGALSNNAVLFGPDGAIAGRYAKSFLWHFDRTWFAPGTDFPTFPIGDARAGLYVCADGRLPEIARTLAAAGSNLFVVSTAWVASGNDPRLLGSPQAEYLSQARAIENGAWLVAADKVGVEAEALIYAGRSGVIDPTGHWVVQAPSDAPGTVTATIDLAAASGPPVLPRPELYAAAAAQPQRFADAATEPIVVSTALGRVAAAALDPAPSAVDLVETVRRFARVQAVQEASLLVLPDLAGDDPHAPTAAELLPALSSLARETGLLLVLGLAERAEGGTYKTCFAIAGDGVRAAHRQTHLLPSERDAGFRAGAEPPPRIETAAGTVGLLAGAEGLVPELARAHRLAGAELLAWAAGNVGASLRVLARARANEQRAYVAAAGDASEDGGAFLVDPGGALLQESLPGRSMTISADVNRAFTRWHRMAPGTDPFTTPRPLAFPPSGLPEAPPQP